MPLSLSQSKLVLRLLHNKLFTLTFYQTNCLGMNTKFLSLSFSKTVSSFLSFTFLFSSQKPQFYRTPRSHSTRSPFNKKVGRFHSEKKDILGAKQPSFFVERSCVHNLHRQSWIKFKHSTLCLCLFVYIIFCIKTNHSFCLFPPIFLYAYLTVYSFACPTVYLSTYLTHYHPT